MLVAKAHADALIFLVGRQKSDSGSDFPKAVVEAALAIADGLQRQSIPKLEQLVAHGILKEICSDKEYGRRGADAS